MLSGRRPLRLAFIFVLSAVCTTRELGLGFSSSDQDRISVSLVPKSTFRRLIRLFDVCCVEVADLAMDSEKSLFESDSQARLVFPLDICLMRLSRSSLFFCRHVDTS